MTSSMRSSWPLAVVEPELELRVGQDDAASTRPGPPRRRRGRARSGSRRSVSSAPTSSAMRVEADVLVVALLGLGGGREERLGQAVALAQAGRQRDAADGARRAGSPSSRCPRGSRARCTRPAGRARGGRSSSGRAARRRRPANSGGQRRDVRAEQVVGRPAPAVSANQKRDRPVSTRPLSGMGVGRTTSKALMRSLATSSSRSVVDAVEVADLAGADERLSEHHG